MRKQLISFAQVIKFLKNIKLKGGFLTLATPLAYALCTEYKLKYQRSTLGYRRKIHSTLRHSSS